MRFFACAVAPSRRRARRWSWSSPPAPRRARAPAASTPHAHDTASFRNLAATRARTDDRRTRCDVRTAGVADWKTAARGNTERTLTAEAGPPPRDPYRHSLAMRPSQKVRPFVSLTTQHPLEEKRFGSTTSRQVDNGNAGRLSDAGIHPGWAAARA